MISIADKDTNSLMYTYPNDIKKCAQIENLHYETLKEELQNYGYYADDDNIYTISQKNKPVAVLVHEVNGIKKYDSINQCLLKEGLNYADLLKGENNGRKIEVLR